MDCITDPLGFPMLWVDEVGAYVHALPVTKAQLEAAMTRRGSPFSKSDWETAQEANARVPLDALDPDTYWSAFFTGVIPGRATEFARFCGAEFRVPSADEWRCAFGALAIRPPHDAWDAMLACSSDRARALMERLAAIPVDAIRWHIGEEASLADRMFFRLGVMEWVVLSHSPMRDESERFGGLGMPAPALWPTLFDPALGTPLRSRAAVTAPHRAFGFRLFRERDKEDRWGRTPQ